MTTRPEALRLADELDENWEYHSDRDSQAAAELRRLHNEILVYHDDRLKLSNEVDRLKAALGLIASFGHRPADEPVAWINWSALTGVRRLGWECESEIASEPLYTTPPAAQRQWVGLTDEEIKPLCDENHIIYGAYTVDFIQSIEAKLKEKNT